MNKKPTSLFVYLLGAYVILQFLWWGYLLIAAAKIAPIPEKQVTARVWMIVGEGSVFLVLLFLGLWKIKSSIKKEVNMARQQQNFMLSVTHELKTPIAATKLYLQTMLKHQLAEEKRLELIQKAIDETNRLELLVEQILTASRIDQHEIVLQKERFDIRHFLTDIIAVQEKRFAMPIVLEPFESFELITDRLLLNTILNNLIENGHKYGLTEKGLSIGLNKTENQLKITVRDFGSGIPIKDQPLIFKKFIRLQNEETRSTKGTGLGSFYSL